MPEKNQPVFFYNEMNENSLEEIKRVIDSGHLNLADTVSIILYNQGVIYNLLKQIKLCQKDTKCGQ